MRCHEEGTIPTKTTAGRGLEEHLQIILIFARIIDQISWACAFPQLILICRVYTDSKNELIRVLQAERINQGGLG